jgi:hypothetical protein
LEKNEGIELGLKNWEATPAEVIIYFISEKSKNIYRISQHIKHFSKDKNNGKNKGKQLILYIKTTFTIFASIFDLLCL